MQHFNHTSAESRLLSQRVDAPRDAAESGDDLEGYTAELRRMTEELRKTYADSRLGSDAREEVRDTVLGTERSLDDIRGNLFESLRKLVPSLGSYVRLGGDGPSAEAGLSWQPDTGRLSFDATAYPDFRGGEYENGRGYSLDDPGSDAEFSALMGTPGSVNLLSLRGPHSDDPLPYTETEEPFYVAPSGLYPNPLAMLRPDYGTDVRRVRTATATGLDALRRSVRPYGTPGRDGFPPAPPAGDDDTEDTRTETEPPVRTGTPGRDGFPAAPPSRTEESAATRRPAAPARRPEAVSTARLEKEMADARREYEAARREATEARRLPVGPDRTARLTRLAERMEGMVTRIETLEQEIKKLRRDIS
ncbi:MAG TPA: hypothetical protein PKV72_01280 [Candidatus Peribacteria bacterium]|nr:hypothetical protein [Candidatus Peribacteria bacterium]